ncbi:hypothetical protein QN277_000701 [Acacia crassicarpa]|uniref:Uncharacterized protein n=1 Tax=Acacia crassicarpa TaxID=499986 RepID=A0AAE1JJ37_9FABA|nr:hypothetical protein QN277_020125 [Acacia crassicarpa]KAK4283784.1 hypothetical protein QN277_000701 [Acacia crassicarpa]
MAFLNKTRVIPTEK